MNGLLDQLEAIVTELAHEYSVGTHAALEAEAKAILREVRARVEVSDDRDIRWDWTQG